jgi:hypothetical protein
MPHVLILLGLMLFLSGCDPGGNQGSLSPSDGPSAPAEQQAIQRLLGLYREALLAEDIDRLQALLQPATALAQVSRAPRVASGTFTDLAAFRQSWSDTFRTHTLTALELPAAEVIIAPDRGSVTFWEVESTLDPGTLAQHTRLFRTTWQLQRTTAGDTVTFGIEAVQRDGPLVQLTTPGQVQAGALARLTVTTPTAGFGLASVGLEASGTQPGQVLRALGSGWHGTFRAASQAPSTPLQVRLRRTSSADLVLSHAYRLRRVDEGVVQPVVGTEDTPLRAVAVAPDGTVWAGGDHGGQLFRVAPGGTEAELIGQLLPDPAGRIEDLTLDGLGRLQAVVFASQSSGVIVRDQGVFCQTVNVVDPAYPLRTANGQSSAGTRVVPAGEDAIWLHGSDGGIARVADDFRAGQCPADGVAVHYAPVLRRQDGGLPANTVPALLVARDGALWVGSALGLNRLQDGQATHVPFDPACSFQRNAATLEAFFQAVAQAVFEARPLTTVVLGGVSFVEAFGSPLVKADLIFSLAEDPQGRLWAGTLGGGLRHVELRQGVP